MTVDVVVPDVMGDLRTWLRGLPDLSALTGQRVFFAPSAKATYPQIRLTEAGGSFQPGETPVWTQRVMIAVSGKPAVDGVVSDYYKVSQAKNIIASAIWQLTGPIGAETWVLDGDIDTVTDQPDPDDGGARKVISTVLTVKAQ